MTMTRSLASRRVSEAHPGCRPAAVRTPTMMMTRRRRTRARTRTRTRMEPRLWCPRPTARPRNQRPCHVGRRSPRSRTQSWMRWTPFSHLWRPQKARTSPRPLASPRRRKSAPRRRPRRRPRRTARLRPPRLRLWRRHRLRIRPRASLRKKSRQCSRPRRPRPRRPRTRRRMALRRRRPPPQPRREARGPVSPRRPRTSRITTRCRTKPSCLNKEADSTCSRSFVPFFLVSRARICIGAMSMLCRHLHLPYAVCSR
mmetsp:Transcript_7279/g.23886  ORF Transcript_7279/g.23886 Transcript_7279/m.23886 type:complete len:256 (+) Transcript_7279:301-1068(+)